MQPVAHSASRHAAVQMGVVCTTLSVVLATAAPPPAPAVHAASSAPGAASGRARRRDTFQPLAEVAGVLSWVMCAAWLAEPPGVVVGQARTRRRGAPPRAG